MHSSSNIKLVRILFTLLFQDSKKESAPLVNGTDCQPTAAPEEVEKLKDEIAKQGDRVRQMKTTGAAKVNVLGM